MLRRFRLILATIAAVFALASCGPFGGGSSGQAAGTIVFGAGLHRVSAYQIQVKSPKTNFRDGQYLAWVAQLKKRIGRVPVIFSVVDERLRRVIWQHPFAGQKPGWIQLARSYPVDAFVVLARAQGGVLPATFKAELTQNGALLASGTFRVRP